MLVANQQRRLMSNLKVSTTKQSSVLPGTLDCRSYQHGCIELAALLSQDRPDQGRYSSQAFEALPSPQQDLLPVLHPRA